MVEVTSKSLGEKLEEKFKDNIKFRITSFNAGLSVSKFISKRVSRLKKIL